MHKQTKVLMIGWELPPHNSGGLGVACAGLSQALVADGVDLSFTLPYYLEDQSQMALKIVDCSHEKWQKTADRLVQPPFDSYASLDQTKKIVKKKAKNGPQPNSQMEQRVAEYAQKVLEFAKQHQDQFEVVHAHDWMSLPAAMKIKQELDKPFVAHIHSTEYDRSLNGSLDNYIGYLEHQGMALADRVVAGSYYTKR